MSNNREFDHPSRYQIRVKGYLDNDWSEWFDGLTITQDEDGTTMLTGTVIDQTALYGLLIKMRDLGLPILLVKRCVDEDRAK
jgi:hypothetical protein